ncbi:MAG TPA: tetratricopeptide repeat protein [Ignavibacteriaceae bacterium]|nr:tetratricopeptide repeat protein [Ignavibacteriaceae bacterium]
MKIKSVLIEFRFQTVFIFIIGIFFITIPSLYSQSKNDLLKTQAEDHMSAGKFGEAINLLNRFISANPQDAQGYNLRGLCYENRKDYEKSVYDFRSAVKLDQKNKTYNQNLERVVKSWETLLYNKIVGFKREIKINPDKPDNYLEVGKCFKNLGNWLEAEKWYDEYIKRENLSADELIRYTEILAKNNHISKGEPLLKNYTEKYPDDHRLWSRYGYFTMWLGKKEIAVKAFEKALELRPYFKEALDGYDLVRGKGYIYTVNDTTSRFNYGLPVPTGKGEYPIDKYYRVLSKKPNDNETRILLINELIKNNRYAEAEEQLNILSNNDAYKNKVDELDKSLELNKNQYYNKRISILEKELSVNPLDKKLNLELAQIFAEKKEYDSSQAIFSKLLNEYPSDEEVLYKFALVCLASGDLNTAYENAEILINKNPDNKNYQLLFGQISTWLNNDPESAKFYLETVLSKEPSNYSALSTLALLLIQNNQLADAEKYLGKLSQLNSRDPEYFKLTYMMEAQKKINEDAELFRIAESAREQLLKKNCDEAIKLFKLYLSDANANPEVRKELAHAYLCKDDFENAISVYDRILLESPDDYLIAKERAKYFLWNKNYSMALDEFTKLNRINPDDAEVKLLLGDSYAGLRDFDKAKEVYEELLVISPSSPMLKERLSWVEGPSYQGGFPVYTMLTPDFNYFTDNFDFLYSTYGLRLDLGITNYLTIGASAYGGILSSDSLTNNISIYKGSIIGRFSKTVYASASLGSTLFPDDENQLLAEVTLKAEQPKVYSFSANFYSMDAAQLLYSPNLVNTRLHSNYFLLMGDYIIRTGWKFAGSYAFITVSDDNKANRLQLRFGKIFDKVVGVGYEYYYYDVKNQTNLYWSPENFESHSIWADWEIVNDADVTANIGGRLGYIPSDEFILREFYGITSVKLAESFTIQGRLTFSTTAQSGKGYTSTSFGISAFWSF